jgi:hypothetical protein
MKGTRVNEKNPEIARVPPGQTKKKRKNQPPARRQTKKRDRETEAETEAAEEASEQRDQQRGQQQRQRGQQHQKRRQQHQQRSYRGSRENSSSSRIDICQFSSLEGSKRGRTRKERTQRERGMGGGEKIGGKRLREVQIDVKAAKRWNGKGWQKEEVQPEGLEEGSIKEKRTEKTNWRVQKGDNVCPSSVRGRIWNGVGIEENPRSESNGIIGSAGKRMPKRPPTGNRVGKGNIIAVLAIEMTIRTTMGSTGRRARIDCRHREIDLNEVPRSPKGASRLIRDKKEAVRGERNSSMKRSASKRGG